MELITPCVTVLSTLVNRVGTIRACALCYRHISVLVSFQSNRVSAIYAHVLAIAA